MAKPVTAATASHHHHVPPSASFTPGEWCSTASATAIATQGAHLAHLSVLRMPDPYRSVAAQRVNCMALAEGRNKAAAIFRRAFLLWRSPLKGSYSVNHLSERTEASA